uniref:VWFA domain-containing protein n=1 Tax=Heterorhabditis bacteriophora TaxID=37862 RepID=A0A1I7XGT9_HETBA
MITGTLFPASQDNGESADCSCYEEYQSITDFGSISIVGPLDSDGYGCEKTCTIYASSGDSTKGLTNLWLAFTPNAGSSSVVIKNDDGSTFVKSSQNSDSSSPEYNKITTTENITITINGDTGVTIMGEMIAADTLGTTTTTPSTTTTTTFPPSPGLRENPKTMAHDIMFAIDVCGTNNKLKEMGKIASDIAGKLSVSVLDSTEAPIYQSRLALTRLTPFGNFAPLAPPWTLTSDGLSKSVLHLQAFPRKCNFTSTLKSAIDTSFNIAGNYPSRPNAQRTILLLTSGLPSDEDNFKDMESDFSGDDVHLVVVGYTLTDKAAKFYNSTTWLSFYSTNTVSTNDIFNNYLLDGNKYCSFTVCSPKSDKNAQCKDLSDGRVSCGVNGTSVSFPSNYMGPQDKGQSDWKANNGQIGRYCNFQNIEYSFSEHLSNITFTIYYDLEVERDFLKVYDGKKEIISLTGKDVSGTKFTASINTRIVFTSDSREVFGGYYIKVN